MPFRKLREDYSTVINTAMKGANNPVSSGGGSSSGKVYICGNGKCDSGETAVTCRKDCQPKISTNSTNNTAVLINTTDNVTEIVKLNVSSSEPVSLGLEGPL